MSYRLTPRIVRYPAPPLTTESKPMTDKGVVYKLVLPPLTTPQIHLDGLAILFPQSITGAVSSALIKAGNELFSEGLIVDNLARIEASRFASRAAMRGKLDAKAPPTVDTLQADTDARAEATRVFEDRWRAGLAALSSAVAELDDEDFEGWISTVVAIRLIKNDTASPIPAADSDV